MSELIDRQELLKCFCITKDGKRIPEVDCDNHEINISIKDIKRIIREQPTVNTRTPMTNILKKLEDELLTSQSAHAEAVIGMCGVSASGYSGEISAYIKAINIVKQEINNGLE